MGKKQLKAQLVVSRKETLEAEEHAKSLYRSKSEYKKDAEDLRTVFKASQGTVLAAATKISELEGRNAELWSQRDELEERIANQFAALTVKDKEFEELSAQAQTLRVENGNLANSLEAVEKTSKDRLDGINLWRERCEKAEKEAVKWVKRSDEDLEAWYKRTEDLDTWYKKAKAAEKELERVCKDNALKREHIKLSESQTDKLFDDVLFLRAKDRNSTEAMKVLNAARKIDVSLLSNKANTAIRARDTLTLQLKVSKEREETLIVRLQAAKNREEVLEKSLQKYDSWEALTEAALRDGVVSADGDFKDLNREARERIAETVAKGEASSLPLDKLRMFFDFSEEGAKCGANPFVFIQKGDPDNE